MVDSNSIPGFRFYPTEEELVSVYLHHKLHGNIEHFINRFMDKIIPVIDIYDFNPWDLPQYSGELCKRDQEQCFFFLPIQESQVQGGRANRLTTNGYWKAIGSPSYVYSCSNNRAIGVKRTMVFYLGRAPNGNKTEWKMNEYKAIDIQTNHHYSASSSSTHPIPTSITPRLRQEFSLCRVSKKSKCIRAFDRRPSTRTTSTTDHVEMISSNINNVPTTLSTPQQAHRHEDEHHDEGSNSYHKNSIDPGLMVERTTLQENSFSGDDHQVEPSQLIGGSISGNNNSPLFIDNDQVLWEWDDLINWF